MTNTNLDVVASAVAITGPNRQAHFYGEWLLLAVRAQACWRRVRSKDPDFYRKVQRIESACEQDFAMSAVEFVSKVWDGSCVTIDMRSEEAEALAMMTCMGFFVGHGECLSMALPDAIGEAIIKRATRKLAETEDEGCMIHPDRALRDFLGYGGR
ncbi:MAG: hypothetical protein K2Y71_15760 [Xanthobacteraceae bacterium]|nr:hypothetical protein [Xanthobacteraceae bacterium]